jgi:hypothetical protein
MNEEPKTLNKKPTLPRKKKTIEVIARDKEQAKKIIKKIGNTGVVKHLGEGGV